MQRLVLALIIVAGLVIGLAIVVGGLRRALAGPDTAPAEGGETIRKIAYAGLLGLVLYVSIAGPD